jgi:sporulation protein YlmC with PRC-barrel domain
MTTDSNKAGPTTLWRTLKGKIVRTNDGKDLGEIKEVSENYLHVEKGTVHKEKFGFQNMLLMLLTARHYGF